jgi:hypothetical protein
LPIPTISFFAAKFPSAVFASHLPAKPWGSLFDAVGLVPTTLRHPFKANPVTQPMGSLLHAHGAFLWIKEKCAYRDCCLFEKVAYEHDSF